MALRQVLLTNTVDQWRASYNKLDSNVGDLAILATANKLSIVGAINEMVGQYDSIATIPLIKSTLSTGTPTRLTYNSALAQFSIPNSGIDSAALASLSVSTLKLQNGVVTSVKIATSAVDSSAIGSLAVSTAKVQGSAITSAKLASAVTLIIYNSAGAAQKTLYGAGV